MHDWVDLDSVFVMAQAKATRRTKPKKKPQKAPKKRALSGGSKVPMERLQMVEQMMSACCTRRDIARAVSKKFDITERTVINYYERIELEWQEEGKPKKSFLRHRMVRQLEQVVKGAEADRKWGPAVAALDKLCKIYGLYEPEVIEVHTPDMHPVEGMTSAQMRSYLLDEQDKAEACQRELEESAPAAPVH